MHTQLTLLHVFPERSALDYAMRGFPHGEWEQAKEEAEKKLAEEVTRAKLTFTEVDSLFRTGLDFRDQILSAAKEVSSDLLVLSTHGYTGWQHLLFGSDAEKILEHAPCPILVVGLEAPKPKISAIPTGRRSGTGLPSLFLNQSVPQCVEPGTKANEK